MHISHARLASVGLASAGILAAGILAWLLIVDSHSLRAQVTTPATATTTAAPATAPAPSTPAPSPAVLRLDWASIPEIIPSIASINDWASPSDSRSTELGCFSRNTEWITDREECVPDQSVFIRRFLATKTGTAVTLPVLSSGAIIVKLDALFTDATDKKKKADALQAAVPEILGTVSQLTQAGATPLQMGEILPLSQTLSDALVNIQNIGAGDLDARVQKTTDVIASVITILTRPAPAPVIAPATIPVMTGTGVVTP